MGSKLSGSSPSVEETLARYFDLIRARTESESADPRRPNSLGLQADLVCANSGAACETVAARGRLACS